MQPLHLATSPPKRAHYTMQIPEPFWELRTQSRVVLTADAMGFHDIGHILETREDLAEL